MQRGESGRNVSASNNAKYPRNAVGHGVYAKNRPRVDHHSMPNHRTSNSNSGYKSEEKERQKQEARAQREMSGRSTAPPPEPREAVFTVVPTTSSSVDNNVCKVLGNYYRYLTNNCNSNVLLGVDEQPQTPAPVVTAHIGDECDDPPVPDHSSGISSSNSSHRPLNSSSFEPPPNRPKATNHRPPSSSFHHNAESSEESKRSHKSGPGPAGSGGDCGNTSRPHDNERISSSSNRLGSSNCNSTGTGSAKLRGPKDLKVDQILNEFKSIIVPSPINEIMTPRPEHHQNSFTFPQPVPPNNQPEFRVPLEPYVKGRSTDRAKPTKSAPVESIINKTSELGLSEDSEDEVSAQSKSKQNERVRETELTLQNTGTAIIKLKNETVTQLDQNFISNQKNISNSLTISSHNLNSESIKKNPTKSVRKPKSTSSSEAQSVTSGFNLSEDLELSEESDLEASNSRMNPPNNPNETYVKPMSFSSYNEVVSKPQNTKSTLVDSSNSDDSSDSESEESSTSDEEPKSQQADTNDWALSTIFKTTNKSESPKHLDGSQKNVVDAMNGTMSPHRIDEVAPPVITTNPAIPKRRKRSMEERPKSKTFPNLSSDDSSDEEQARKTSKSQKSTGYNKIPRIKLPDPNLSSDSEENTCPPQPSRRATAPKTSKPSRGISKSPRLAVAPPQSKRKKKPDGKRKESSSKSKDCAPSDIDSDSDWSTARLSKQKMKPQSAVSDRSSQSVRHSPKLKPPGDIHKEPFSRSFNKSKTTFELKCDMRLKMSVPVSPTQVEMLKPCKNERPEKKRRSRSDKENKSENVPDEPVNSRLEPPPSSVLRGSPLQRNSLAGQVQYENGVAKLVCSIPLGLIDQLPSVKSEDKMKKEVLEMRTSGVDKRKTNHSPINEDNKKLAIWSIYKKRPSSLEPDKIKREIKLEDPLKGKSDDNQPVKIKIKIEHNDEIKIDAKPKYEISGKMKSKDARENSNSSTSSKHKSKKHKKDKRKERSSSKELLSKELNYESDTSTSKKKKTTHPSSQVESPNRKRSRDCNSREDVRCEESSNNQHVKKMKISSEDHLQSPTSSRLMSEERPSSAMSGEHSSSRRTKKSSHPLDSKIEQNEEEEDAALEEEEEETQFRKKPFLREEEVAGTSGDPLECHFLPSSEHESRCCVGGGGSYHSEPSPHPSESTDMYPPGAHDDDAGPLHQLYTDGTMSSYHPPICYPPNWDRRAPEVRKDHSTYLNIAKDLKHKADVVVQQPLLQAIMYLEAVIYFILTGESMLMMDIINFTAPYKMFNDTVGLIKHVSSIFQRGEIPDMPNKIVSIIGMVLSLRCQSLLSLKGYTMKCNELKETQHKVLEAYIRNYEMAEKSSTPCSGSAITCAATGGGGTPGLPNGWSQRSVGANHSPSSLSPTPSPAGSVGSEGSQSSSGYSTEGGQAGPTTLPVGIHKSFLKFFHLTKALRQAYDYWNEAEELMHRHQEIREFFYNIDCVAGPLTFHVPLRELVLYMQEALNHLKAMTSQNQAEVASTKTRSGVK